MNFKCRGSNRKKATELHATSTFLNLLVMTLLLTRIFSRGFFVTVGFFYGVSIRCVADCTEEVTVKTGSVSHAGGEEWFVPKQPFSGLQCYMF